MSTYQQSGVNVSLGDECSRIAYEAAKKTFPSRHGMIGAPVADTEGGFTGMLDMGDYYLVQNDDGIGTKMMLAEEAGIYGTMGYDLLAMVVDDAICAGAEVISMTNTIDVDKVDKQKISALMQGLQQACVEQKVVIPGGEIAELGAMSNGYIWNATAVGIVEKHKVITGQNIQPGDPIVGFYSPGFRSNGFSLVRHVLQQMPDREKYLKACLQPCIIYHDMILQLHGRYQQPSQIQFKGIAHITGGGIPGNITRMLDRNGLGAAITDPFKPDPIVLKIQEAGNVADREAYETWNMGVGMALVADDPEKLIAHAAKNGIKAQVIGEVTSTPTIEIVSRGASSSGERLVW